MKWMVIIFFLFFIGCDMKNDNVQADKSERSMNQPLRSIVELKKDVLNKGDTDAYYELDVAYLDEPFQEEFLIYAMIMANKYDYTQAYYDVFIALTNAYWGEISEIDEQTADLAIDYLLKAYEKGHHQAKDDVEKYEITSTENSKEKIKMMFKK